MSFHVGQKVVCVDVRFSVTALPWKLVGSLDGLTRNQLYTVRDVGPWAGFPCIWLNEIERPVVGHMGAMFGEAGYLAARFRAVVERKTDISIFTALLNTKRVTAPVS